MSDNLTLSQRRRCMSSNRGRDTKPELIVRRLIHQIGFRYRLHNKNLPGYPDIVFNRLQKLIFVNGCFWHSHSCVRGQSTPTTNMDFWQKKRRSTVDRDRHNVRTLRLLGWDVLTVWECQIRNIDILRNNIIAYLSEQSITKK